MKNEPKNSPRTLKTTPTRDQDPCDIGKLNITNIIIWLGMKMVYGTSKSQLEKSNKPAIRLKKFK